mgnify:CR=1 FL=1
MNKIVLKESDIIVLPTDTVYGIGCKMQATSTLARLFEIKKRPIEKAIPVLVSSVEQASQFACFTNAELKLANRFWPGALTLILKTKKEFLALLGETVAVRMPRHKETLEIIRVNGPLRVTSCNISGEKPLTRSVEIKTTFKDKVQHYVFDENEASFSNLPSTIVKLFNNNTEFLRIGEISQNQILDTLSYDKTKPSTAKIFK